jgi:hypothetical protein
MYHEYRGELSEWGVLLGQHRNAVDENHFTIINILTYARQATGLPKLSTS